MNEEKTFKPFNRGGGEAASYVIDTNDLKMNVKELADHRWTLVRLFDILLTERTIYPMNHIIYIRETRLCEELLKAIKEIDSRLTLAVDTDTERMEERLSDEDIPF